MNKYFRIPDFVDQEKQRRADILVVTQFSLLVLIIAIIIFSAFTAPEHTETYSLGGAGVLAIIFSYVLLRNGKLEAACWMIVILGWLVFTVDLAAVAGIRGVSVHGQILIVIFAGLALNGKTALMITFLSLIANFGILRLEQVGILANPLPLPASDTRWFIQTVYIILAAIYIWTADRVLKKALSNSNETADRYRALFERTNDGVVIYSLEWDVISANTQALDLLGYSEYEFSGLNSFELEDPENPDMIRRNREKILQGDTIPMFEDTLVRKDGGRVPVELSMALVHDAKGNPRHVQCIMRDITNRKGYEQQLEQQALYDPLTNLPNRTLFEDRYQLVQSRRQEGHSLIAVLFIDIDEFKLVNDTYGHTTGDQVLVKLGERLQEVVRESDTVARMGGDEFLIILDNISNKSNVSRVAEKLVECITHPFQVGEHLIRITASIGINIAEKSNLSDVDLVKTSDTAMYQVKEDGKNDFKFYDSVDPS